MPEVEIVPDREKAAARGVALSSIAQNVNALIGGAVMTSNTQYPKERHRYDIRIRLVGEERDRAANVNALRVRNNRGQLIPLSQVVRIEEKPTLQIISRRNRERAVSVYANVAQGHSQEEALKLVEKRGKELLPPGYHIVLTGSAQTYRETLQSLLYAMLLGIFVSYMVLASQFNSFWHPVSVLMAMPFSVSGAFLALYLCHQSINIFSLIGLILLLGIVKKNSILLVDFTNQKRREGLAVKDALLAACPVRLRPILMTSVATVAGAIPVALAIGPGSETRVPMAVAIIGGVIASTVLTLVVVPCVYQLLTRLERTQTLASDLSPHFD
jgi:HAE1 family hydrophobic/amphiphilic exporter-1